MTLYLNVLPDCVRRFGQCKMHGKDVISWKKKRLSRRFLKYVGWFRDILGDPGVVRGGGKKIRAKKSQERGEESPWGQGFSGPVPNRRGSSGFWSSQNLCFFCAQLQSSKIVSCLLTRTHTYRPVARHTFVWVVRQGITRGEKFQSQHKMSRWFFAISVRNSPEIPFACIVLTLLYLKFASFCAITDVDKCVG